MKKMDFIFIGSPKNKSYQGLEGDYHTRIRRYVDSEIIYLKDSPEKNTVLKTKKESQEILRKINPENFVVVCDERGRSFSTMEFSAKIKNWQQGYQRFFFIVGGAYGLADEVLNLAGFVLRLSDFTMPHELARVVLLEQVYRGLSLLHGEKYHH